MARSENGGLKFKEENRTCLIQTGANFSLNSILGVEVLWCVKK